MIEIVNKSEQPDFWQFKVAVEGLTFAVRVDKDYWRKLTGGKGEPEELVRKSFEFLLAREPKESILPSFDLREIQNYFPEYEKEIKKL